MRVLVTGATGFIGRQSLQPLLDSGFEVHAIHLSTITDTDSRIIWHRYNLLEENLGYLCDKIKATHLLHFAWYVNPIDYKSSSENEHWKRASISLLKAFRESGGTRAVLAGTCMEYDWNIAPEFFDENSPTLPDTPYGVAKNETHEFVEAFAAKSGLSYAWGRIFNLYGPFEADRRLVPEVIHALLADRKPHIEPGITLDYSYVKDVADAFVTLLKSNVRGAVNIASGKPVSLYEVAGTIADILNKKELLRDLPAEDEIVRRVVADVQRLTKEVGWQPQYSLRSGLEETIEWWKKR